MSDWITIRDRIKYLEDERNGTNIPVDAFYLVRLGGCSFATFIHGMESVHGRIVESIEQTTEDLVHKYHAVTGFCHSDEIVLLFSEESKCDAERRQLSFHEGNVQKLCSILASYASVCFNKHVSHFDWEPRFRSRIEEGVIFECRLIVPRDTKETFNCFSWRRQMLLKEKDSRLLTSGKFSRGTFVKCKHVSKPIVNRTMDRTQLCIKIVTLRFKLEVPIDEDFIFRKYVDESL